MIPNVAPSEDAIQMAVAQYLDLCGVLWVHVPLGGHRHRATAMRLAACGTKAGVPDVLIFTPPPREKAVGAALELKRDKGGRVSPAQRRWIDDLKQVGWATAVCCGIDEAMAMLGDWGYLPRPGATETKIIRPTPVRRKRRRPLLWGRAR